jgi:hypothetical protein
MPFIRMAIVVRYSVSISSKDEKMRKFKQNQEINQYERDGNFAKLLKLSNNNYEITLGNAMKAVRVRRSNFLDAQLKFAAFADQIDRFLDRQKARQL